MQLVSKELDSGKLVVYVDPGKLTIPIPDKVMTPQGEEYLDTDEKKALYYQTAIAPYLLFNVETYETLNKADPEAWSIVFKSANIFLNTLTDDEKLQMCMGFISMHRHLKEMRALNMVQTIDTIGDILVMMDDAVHFSSKLIDFVDKRMPLPNLDNAGERPHDTDEMTFRRPHMVELTSIALLCKILTPIFGQFFWQYKNHSTLDNSIKEVHCASMLRKLFELRNKALILKFNHFVANTVAQHYKKNDDIVSAYGGNTAESHALTGAATIFTRKFITVDLNKEDGNLMTYVTVCLNHSVETQYKTPASKKIQERTMSNLKDTVADEGNASRMETESIATAKTADIPIISKWAARYIVELYKNVLEIPKDVWESAMAYYRMNLPPMTPVSNYLLCTFFGKAMGGALSISMLPAAIYAELSIILQYLIIKKGYYSLAHALMIIPLNKRKSILGKVDNHVRMSFAGNYSFSNLKRRFPIESASIECAAKMKEIVDFLVMNIHSFNTAPVFWDMMGEESRNGHEFVCEANIMETMSDFIIYAIDSQYEDMRE